MTQTQPKVHTIDGKQYVEVKRQAEVDELITPIFERGCYYPHFTEGYYYEVECADRNGEVTVLDDNNSEHILSIGYYRVLEPIDQSPQSLEDVTANLTRRLAELERQVADNLETIEEQSLRLTALESEITFTPEQLASLIDVYRGGTTHD